MTSTYLSSRLGHSSRQLLTRISRPIIQPIITTNQSIRHQGQKAAPNPTAASDPQSHSINTNRATEKPGVGSTGGSTAKPVDSHDYTGNSEEGQDPAKSDPNESTETKRKNVLEQGNKPLDAADK